MSVELKHVLRVEDPCGPTYYLGFLYPTMIRTLTFVPVVTKTPGESSEPILNEEDGGYQRAGDAARMEKIKKFVMGRRSCVIPPVLLSARGKWIYKPSGSNKHVGAIEAEDLAAIIDGQHRLGGLWRLVNDSAADQDLKDRPIPFMAVDDMEIEQEKQEFVDINDNQKGVKKSLLRYLDRESTFAGIAATALMEDEESVFKGRIDIQKKHDWIIVLFGAIVECNQLMFSRDFTIVKEFNPHQDQSIRESALEFVLRYWATVKDCLPEYWSDMDKMPPIGARKSKEARGTSAFEFRLLEETGIRAFSRLAAELFTVAWIDAIKAPSWEAIEQHLKKMAAREKVRRVLTKPKIDPSVLDMDPDLKSSGKAGVEAIFRHLKAELQQVIQQ